jgi:hypothetical protein
VGTAYEPEQVWASWSEQLLGWGTDFHELLLGDELRMRAYRQAIEETVRLGDVVVDLGTGTGVLARWAIEAGAAHVYAIERDAELLERATATFEYPIAVQPHDRIALRLTRSTGNVATTAYAWSYRWEGAVHHSSGPRRPVRPGHVTPAGSLWSPWGWSPWGWSL